MIMLCGSQSDLYNTLNSNKSSPSSRASNLPILYIWNTINDKVVIAELNNSIQKCSAYIFDYIIYTKSKIKTIGNL